MALYQLQRTQLIAADMETVWDFISSPRNLARITPPYMDFRITNEPIAEKMYAGMIICYTVRPVLGIRMNWATEITHVAEHRYFVDEQRTGPYKLWHHQHSLESVEGGVLMKDIVSYIPPMGILGSWANRLFLHRQLEDIFDYRFRMLEQLFPISK